MNQISRAILQEQTEGPIAPQDIVWLSASNSTELVGTKAANLGKLLAAGFNVPPGFCVAQPVYNKHFCSAFTRADLTDMLVRNQFCRIQQRILDITLDKPLVAEILEHYRGLGRSSGVAVRSSSTAEDLEQHSFAGLYESLLNVADENGLLEAIQLCWASYWSEGAVLYRQRLGMNHTEHGMAVLVQQMVAADSAGVLFTQDPFAPETNSLVIEVVEGSGDPLMRGDVRGFRHRVSRDSGQLLPKSSSKNWLERPLLDSLVSVGLAIEEQLGTAQDIEWCVDQAGQVWVLQTRPITVTPDLPGTFSQKNLPQGWRRAYDEPFSSLGCDLAERRHRCWIRAVNHFHKTSFQPALRSIDGFLYYDSPWETASRWIHLWMRFWRLLRWLQGPRIVEHYTTKVLPTHLRRLAELEQRSLSDLDEDEFLRSLNASIEIYLDFQLTSHAIGVVGATAASFLNRLCQSWFRPSRFTALDFVSGLDTLSVKRDLEIHRLGQLLKSLLAPSEIAVLDYSRLSTVKEKDETGEYFWNEFQTFLTTYGYVWADKYPRDPAWEFNEQAVVASLVQAAQLNPRFGLADGFLREQQHRLEATREVFQELLADDRLPMRRWIFRWFQNRAEQLFPYKEDRNHYVYQAVMVIRKYAHKIGTRLKERQLLRCEDDVFFLNWKEIQEILSVEYPPPCCTAQVELRKNAYHRARQKLLRRNSASLPRTVTPQTSRFDMAGEPCSPGVAAGPARLISGLGELHRVQPGDIMVCGQLRPAWTSVFSRAAGVVIEMGSLLSHGSTLAREYGIPAIINVPNLTNIVREGDQLTIDGHLGRIVLERCIFENHLRG